MIILIGAEKGGTGKSTLAVNIAARRASEGRSVMLVDTDTQSSAGNWAAVRQENESLPPVSCVQVFGKSVAKQASDLAQHYDDVVVDAGGRDSVELRSAMVVANGIFIPLQPSQFDVWTIEVMDELVEQAQSINPSLESAVVINRASPHPQVREAGEALGLLDEFDNLHYSGVQIHDRIAFKRCISNGVSVWEMDSPDPKAVAEMNTLYTRIYKPEVSHA